MKKWFFHGEPLDRVMSDEIYVQFMANLCSAVTTAVLIGGYHFLFHV